MPVDTPFFDSSYVVRLYLEDQGFETVRELAGRGQVVACAWHGQAEVVAALHRAFRERRMDVGIFRAMLEQLGVDTEEGLFRWLPLSDKVQQRLAVVFAAAPTTLFLRAADALHLACAAEHGFREVYSNDRRFLEAAPLFGLKGRNVIG
ncbi:MAG: type II toxin-antitoxin system VapC family toxin [Verrucomicrobiales bacterium]|nr:type II toxin-antitoxin system VapC family toxin [Verrucomicrobiales bacterium]